MVVFIKDCINQLHFLLSPFNLVVKVQVVDRIPIKEIVKTPFISEYMSD